MKEHPLIRSAKEAQRALRQLSAREQMQAECKHVFMGVEGTTAYLRCPKCGLRADSDD